MLFFSISCRYLKQLYNYLISANACYMIISINVKSGCHRRNFNTKVSRGEFLCLFFFFVFTYTCAHTQKTTQKNVLPFQMTGPHYKQKHLSPACFLHLLPILDLGNLERLFGYCSRDSTGALLRPQFPLLFLFFCFSFPFLMPV